MKVMRDVSNGEDLNSRLSKSKSKKHIIFNLNSLQNKLKEKEQGWNQRFHLQQIPQYTYLNQPQLQGFKQRLKQAVRHDKIDFTSGKPRRNNNKQVSLERHKVTNKPNGRRTEERQHEAIRKAFFDLKQLWYEKNIPQQHMQAVSKILANQNNPMKVLEDIKKEFNEIEKENSLIQKAYNSISARQKCLQKLLQFIRKVNMQDSKIINSPQQEFEQKINQLRILTIHSVESVYQWKQSLQEFIMASSKQTLDLKWNGVSYFEKIKQDYTIFQNCKLSTIYKFPDRSDPFLVTISYRVSNKKAATVSKSIMKRIRLCEVILQQPAASTPNLTESSLNLKMKTLPSIQEQPLSKILIEYSQFPQYLSGLCNKSCYKSISSSIDHSKHQQYTVFTFDKHNQIVLAVDRNSSQRKIIVLAIYTTSNQIFQPLLLTTSTYLWQHDHCSEIRIGLIHLPNQKGLGVDLQLQKKLKSLGFRWICVNNSANSRITIYALKRPMNIPSPVNQMYPIIIQHLTQAIFPSDIIIPSSSNKSFLSIVSILKQIQQSSPDFFQRIASNPVFKDHLLHLQSAKAYTYTGLKSFQLTSQETVEKFLASTSLKPYATNAFSLPSYVSLLNLSFKFKHTNFLQDNFFKFFPNKEAEIIICSSKSYPIYLLSTDEENITIFIFEVQANFKDDQIDSVFNGMNEEQASFLDQFWLPVFSKNLQYHDQVSFKNDLLISTNYRTRLQSLTRKTKSRTKTIKAPFVFGLINKELIQMVQKPFFASLITKQDLI